MASTDCNDAGSDMQLSESESDGDVEVGAEDDGVRLRRSRGGGQQSSVQEEDVELEEEEDDEDDGDDVDDGEEEDEEDDEVQDEDEAPDNDGRDDDHQGFVNHSHSRTPSPPPQRPRLKIKLRLPAHPSSSSNTASTPARTPAPEDASRASSRHAPSADFDVESEDDDNDPGGDKDQARSTPSTSVTASGRPMTTRQAVLASVVDSTHVSLSETSRKKKPLNDAELALRREETARKRKNLSEKKLEDEKAETINRLLKKQSRSKNKRSGLYLAEDRTPHSSSHPPTNTNTGAPSTPVPQSLLRQGTQNTEWDGEVGDPDLDMLMDPETAGVEVPAVPEMYRWISTTKSRNGGRECVSAEGTMRLSFSVPISVTGAAATASRIHEEERNTALPIKAEARCDVDGCTKLRKYRFVQDCRRGACGMPHLKVLELEAA